MSDNQRKWVEYEQFVKQIVSQIYETVEGIAPEQVGSGRKNRLRGESGYEHQIDVSVKGPEDFILIECKHLKRKVSVGAVLTFFGRTYDIEKTFDGQVHCEIVTTQGFQSGAKIMAEYLNVGLQIIRSPNEYTFQYKDLSRTALSHKIVVPLTRGQ